jgi:hypothetical protein
VTGLTREFVENVPMTFELPPGSVLHTTKPDGESYEFTVFKEPA